VFESLTVQEREDITASAQMALRMLVYRQIYKVLDMQKLERRGADTNSNKRRIGSSSEDVTAAGAEEKKLKEDDADVEA
jgi:hypothetical protein